jgi:signal transduction histidine kinase/CheY-like chemotaxis protein
MPLGSVRCTTLICWLMPRYPGEIIEDTSQAGAFVMEDAFFLLRGLDRVRDGLRLRGPLAGDPTARVLHALLLTLLIWFALATLGTLPLSPMTGARSFAVLTTEATLTAALICLYLGHFRGASVVYLAGTWLFTTVVMTFNGGIRSPVQVFFVTLPISAAWLLGFRGSLWTAGVCLATALVFAILEGRGVRVPQLIPASPYGLWAVLVEACLIGAVPVAQVLRTLRNALVQSRRAEEELNRYRQHLEQLVDQRTAELVQARDQAQAANQAKSVFLASMSHELRTPLTAILGFSNLLREHGATAEQQRDLDIINRSGEHLLSLIDDVLQIARIEAGRTFLEVGPCDLEAVVNEVVEMMRVRAREKQLSLILTEPPSFPRWIQSDSVKLRQVLINLLGNAVKYTPTGSITLRLDVRPAGGGGQFLACFEVEDTGIGISAEDQARIFEPFEQAADGRRQKGAGLGLAITRQFVELMGGTITVESAPGKGSCFRVEIPVEETREIEVTPPAAQERILGLEAGQPEYRVLVVEDQRENWMLLERLLRNAGFPVRVAENGEEGVKVFQEWRPHFIWMDVRMPVMDGIEAARRVRALEGGRDVKIAAITASGSDGSRAELLAAGLDDVVRKPYRPHQIFERMARHLGVRYRRAPAVPLLKREPAAELRPDAIAALPAVLRAELLDALTVLDVDRILRTVAKVAEQDADLGFALELLAKRYAYTAMLEAIEGSSQSARHV